MKSVKYLINVREKDCGKVVCQISRKLTGRMIGNFHPMFCVYNKKEYLVKSVHGDLSDPFRCNKDYYNGYGGYNGGTGLYIELKED